MQRFYLPQMEKGKGKMEEMVIPAAFHRSFGLTVLGRWKAAKDFRRRVPHDDASRGF